MYGSDKVLLFLAQGLQSGRNFQPIVVLPKDGALRVALQETGIEVHIAEVGKISRSIMTPTGLIRLAWSTLNGMRALDKIVGKRKVALVHSNTLAVLSGAIWAFIRRRPHLWHIHEIILKPKLVSKGYPRLVRLLADRVMSNSTLTEHWLLSEQPSLKSRSVVVFNGLPEVVRPAKDAIQAFRARVGANEGDTVVMLAGRINRMKGQELLIEAASVLQRRGKIEGMRFVIIGETAPGLMYLSAQLKTQVASLCLDTHFTFLPFIDDMWPVWFGTDIGVVPSTEPESFGMVAIEAMAAGVPVIAAGHGGLLDIVVHEETGLLFPPRNVNMLADALERLGSDSMLRKTLGATGLTKQQELFSVESQVTNAVKVYEEMTK